ncbi:MAG: 3',5'-nucleoside bisphosphate phosphatase [Burkholderiaceae bacterium]|jgi:predicted metal-dependent phosphoesterase TrpH
MDSAPKLASHTLNADLHCHSIVSDGTLTPGALALRAKAAGVALWSLTDHDELGGQAEAAAAARSHDLAFIAGVEVSVTWQDDTIHIVGLNIDYRPDSALQKGLHSIREGRGPRARHMGELLAQAGIPGAYEGALSHAGNPMLISRTHFARFLVEAGRCKDVREVFTRYMVPGKPGYVPHRWATLEQAVAWIRASGGRAVLAHPGRYKLDNQQLHTLIEAFIAVGGEGIEVVTGSHTPAQYAQFARLAAHYELLASRGSDFHGPSESRIDLGRLPLLPAECTPVWHDWIL